LTRVTLTPCARSSSCTAFLAANRANTCTADALTGWNVLSVDCGRLELAITIAPMVVVVRGWARLRSCAASLSLGTGVATLQDRLSGRRRLFVGDELLDRGHPGGQNSSPRSLAYPRANFVREFLEGPMKRA